MSDTHGHLDQKMINHINWADEVWHAGDIGKISITDQLSKLKPVRAVFGNIDSHLFVYIGIKADSDNNINIDSYFAIELCYY